MKRLGIDDVVKSRNSGRRYVVDYVARSVGNEIVLIGAHALDTGEHHAFEPQEVKRVK